mmetsp:Transcript_18053/g.28002  ORF Transcript_18053/g.28002 Transcript_18053/m.28002 type:complete len:91 (-) Transcript_18053:4-276(-)
MAACSSWIWVTSALAPRSMAIGSGLMAWTFGWTFSFSRTVIVGDFPKFAASLCRDSTGRGDSGPHNSQQGLVSVAVDRIRGPQGTQDSGN